MSGHRLLTREALSDVLVNLVPLGVLAGFAATFVVASPYATVPVYTTVQLSLVVVPAAVLLVLTYYALRAVDAAEREAEEAPSSEASETEAETATATGDD